MERNRIIKGWVADINFPKLGYWSFGGIRIKLKTNRFNDEQIIKKLLEIPEFAALAIVMGEHDLITGVLAKSGDHATEILRKISNIDGVQKCEYEIALSVLKPSTDFNPLSYFKMSSEKS
jgi:DNA-binding Lrp family transcriptional regulator